MQKATNSVLVKKTYDDGWMTFSIKRKSDPASVHKVENGETEIWEEIPVALADNLFQEALENGYKVAF